MKMEATEKIREKIWKEIDMYPNYEVSSSGEVRRKCAIKILKQCKSKSGYALVRLYNKDGGKTFYVHQIVALTFIGESPYCPTCGAKYEINHKDEITCNNKHDNLEYITRQKNVSLSLEKTKNGTIEWWKSRHFVG